MYYQAMSPRCTSVDINKSPSQYHPALVPDETSSAPSQVTDTPEITYARRISSTRSPGMRIQIHGRLHRAAHCRLVITIVKTSKLGCTGFRSFIPTEARIEFFRPIMIPSRTNLINILVPVKRAIDYAVKIRIAKDGKGVDTTVKHSMVCPWLLACELKCIAQYHAFAHYRTLLTRSVSS